MSTEFIDAKSLLTRAAAHFKGSPLGVRIGADEQQFRSILWLGSCVWSMVETLSQGTSRPSVRIVNPHVLKISDGGYWLDPKVAGLPPYGSLEILNVPPHDTSSLFDKSPFAQWVDHYPKPRLRNTSKAELIAQIQRSSLTLLFDLDLIDPATDISWLSHLREGQLLVPAFFPARILPGIVALTNAGAHFTETLFTTIDSDGDPAHFPVYAFRSFGAPLDSPIPPPVRHTSFSGDHALRIRSQPGSSSGPLCIGLTTSCDVTEDGRVISLSESAIQTAFELGALHHALPRAARFAHAVATGTTRTTLALRDVQYTVPPLTTSITLDEVVRTAFQVLRKRSASEHATNRDEHGRGLVTQAVLTGAPPKIVADLISCGIDPDDVDHFGWPATAYAAVLNRPEIVNELAMTAFADLELQVEPGLSVDEIIRLCHIKIESPDLDVELDDDSDTSTHSSGPQSVPSPLDPDQPHSSKPSATLSGSLLAESIPIFPSSSPYGDPPITAVSRRPLSDSLSSIISRMPARAEEDPVTRAPGSPGPVKPLSQEDFSALLPSGPATPVRTPSDAPNPESSRPSRSLSEVEPIFASVVDIPSRIEPGAIRAAIHSWISQTSPDLAGLDPTLPRFDSKRFSILSDEDPGTGLFALRFDNHVPFGLTFRTEFVVFPTETATIVSTRLQAIRPPGNEDDVEPSVPRIVASFAELGARHRNLPVGKVLPVSNQSDAELLSAIIFDPHRVAPLLAIFGNTDYVLAGLPPAVRAALLIVHVSPAAVPLVQRQIGRDFIGLKGAWRVYPPGLKRDSSRYDAPLILDPGSITPSRLANQFRHTIWRLSRSLTEDDCPTYLAARQLILQRQKATQSRLDAIQPKAAVSSEPLAPPSLDVLSEPIEVSHFGEPSVADAAHETPALAEGFEELSEVHDQIRGLLASIADLHARIDQTTRQHRSELQSAMDEIRLWKDLAEDADAKVNGLIAERDRAKREAFDLRAQLSFITGGGLSSADSSPSGREYPTSYDALADWVETHYEGRILMTKKALKAAMSVRSEPHIVAKVYESLDILANEYIDSKQGDPDARQRYLERLATSQITISHVGEAVNNHRYASEYSATVGNRRYLCDMHVREFGGTDFHPERQLRIYFAFDEANGRVIIGHLPTHLTSTHS